MRQRPPKLRVGKPREMPMAWAPPRDERGSAHSRGYGVNWRRLREVVLDAEPLCRHCMERGKLTPAAEVDHIMPCETAARTIERTCSRCAGRVTTRKPSAT
jgi:5-methylcytosine-specific restriction protein A